jgi:hypothetical protein
VVNHRKGLAGGCKPSIKPITENLPYKFSDFITKTRKCAISGKEYLLAALRQGSVIHLSFLI